MLIVQSTYDSKPKPQIRTFLNFGQRSVCILIQWLDTSLYETEIQIQVQTATPVKF